MFDIEKAIKEATELYSKRYEENLRSKLDKLYLKTLDKEEQTYCNIWDTYLNNCDAGMFEQNLKHCGYDIIKEEVQSSDTLALPRIKLKLIRTTTIAEV